MTTLMSYWPASVCSEHQGDIAELLLYLPLKVQHRECKYKGNVYKQTKSIVLCWEINNVYFFPRMYLLIHTLSSLICGRYIAGSLRDHFYSRVNIFTVVINVQ